MAIKEPVDALFTRRHPKIELHAHLTGSIRPETLHEIWRLRSSQASTSSTFSSKLDDPLELLSPSKTWDIRNFFTHFSSYIYNLIIDKDSLMYSTNAVLADFARDGVVYLELRTTPRASETMSKEEYVGIVLECMRSSTTRDQMSTHLILSIDRRNTIEEAMQVVDLAVKYHSQGIVGVDLCGDPSKGEVFLFAPAFAKAKQAGFKITLHFAEVPASSSQQELETLLSFEPDRLGHVIHVPDIIKAEIVRRRIPVELCISCNVQAKMTEGGVVDHHFGWWKDSGCPVVLCVSDPSEQVPL